MADPNIGTGVCPSITTDGESNVWYDREVTAIKDVQLREPALDGVDSSLGRQCPKEGEPDRLTSGQSRSAQGLFSINDAASVIATNP